MDKLVITSCLAANTHPGGRAVAGYINQRLGINTEFAVDIPWQERQRRLTSGQIHMGWICGLLYVRISDQPNSPLELLAAPVMRGPRYAGRPVYFSDIIVRQDSQYYSLSDLRGMRWVYNEPESYSGYYTMCHQLIQQGETLKFFKEALESGGHSNSLQMVLDGRADVIDIDSTLLDYEFDREPALVQKLRVIDSLGPNPVPPWVVSRQLHQDLREQLRVVLLSMHLDPNGRTALASGQLSRFVPADDEEYQMIRDVSRSITAASQP